VNESYAPQTLLTLNFSLPEVQYARPPPPLNFNEQIAAAALDSVSGVQAASLVTYVLTRMEELSTRESFRSKDDADAARRSAQTPSWR